MAKAAHLRITPQFGGRFFIDAYYFSWLASNVNLPTNATRLSAPGILRVFVPVFHGNPGECRPLRSRGRQHLVSIRG